MPDLETLCRVSTKGKHANQAAPDGNAPLSPLRGTSTRRGKSTRRSALGLISITKYRAARKSIEPVNLPLRVHSEHILKKRQRRAKFSESFLHGKACHWILRSRGSPTNPVPLPTFRWKTPPQVAEGVHFPRAKPGCKVFPSPSAAVLMVLL